MFQDKQRVWPAAYPFLHIAAAFTLILLSASAFRSNAQSPVRKATIEERQGALRSVAKVNRKPSEASLEPPPPAYEQSREDFALLQVIKSHLSAAVGSSHEFDYRQIAKNAAEVRKRAARLKTNLLLPELEKGEKIKKGEEGFSPEALKSEVGNLNALIKSFVENPVFQQPGVLDVNYSVRARRDLEMIIRLSERIQRRAEALGKTAGK
jgi:cytochrome c556